MFVAQFLPGLVGSVCANRQETEFNDLPHPPCHALRRGHQLPKVPSQARRYAIR